MSFFKKFVDGVRVRHSPANGDLPFAFSAEEFAEPMQIHTGKAESQWVGSLLIWFAAQGGEWHWVPWRMLRNQYMHYGAIRRLLLASDRQLPCFYEEEPVVEWTLGRRGQPPETLTIGVQDLCEHGLVSLWKTKDGEAMLFPTEKLLGCRTTGESPMTVKRHMFPFGVPEFA